MKPGDWPGPAPVLDKLYEEIDEVRAELARGEDDPQRAARLEDEIGDVLFVCLTLARKAGVDAGGALRHANAKFERRFRAMEAEATREGLVFAELELEAQEALWQRIKRHERAGA